MEVNGIGNIVIISHEVYGGDDMGRVEQRYVSTSLPPVHVSSHRRVTGGLIHDTSHGSEGEVWGVGAYLWGHHRHDRRLCMGGMDHLGHDHKG